MIEGSFRDISCSRLSKVLPVYCGFNCTFRLTFQSLWRWMIKFRILCVSTFACRSNKFSNSKLTLHSPRNEQYFPSLGPQSRYNILFAVSVCYPILFNFFTLDSRRSCQTRERDTKSKRCGRGITCVTLYAYTWLARDSHLTHQPHRTYKVQPNQTQCHGPFTSIYPQERP